MLAGCVLSSGGQRPEVFGRLQAPSNAKLKGMKIDAIERGLFELKTVLEKICVLQSYPM